MQIESQDGASNYSFVKITDFMAPIVKEMAAQISNGLGDGMEKEKRLQLYVGSKPASYYTFSTKKKLPGAGPYSVVDAKDANKQLGAAKLVEKGTYGPGYAFTPLGEEQNKHSNRFQKVSNK